jgi:hypothetical protein
MIAAGSSIILKISDAVCTVFEFLMMGGITAWNMYSISQK